MTEYRSYKKTRLIVFGIVTLCGCLGGTNAFAGNSDYQGAANLFIQDPDLELGYLTPEQIEAHKANPHSADNPVTAAQENAKNFPLLQNPQGFNDEFNPRDFSRWQVVQLGPETGAACGDGSPYKFFVNRRPNTVNMVLYLEPGGACFDYNSCSGTSGIRGARNPNGIADDYLNQQATNSISPLISSALTWLAPQDYVEPIKWSAVYLPYCTGDIYSGDKVATYVNPENPDEELLWLHNGVRNVRAVLAWLKNNLPKPPQLLATGCSAGGVGSLINYAHLRADLDPVKGYLINDSGPIYNAPVSSNRADHPSLPLHLQIRDTWGLDDGFLDYLGTRVPNFNGDDLGTLYGGLAAKFSDDRLGHTQFWADRTFSSYSYERFHPEMALGNTPNARWPLLRTRWEKDTTNLISELNNHKNFGYYIPRERNFNESHCTTIVTFHNTEIHELGLTTQKFIADILDGSGPVLEGSETNRNDPGYFSFILWIAGMSLPAPSVVQDLDEPVVIEFLNSFTDQNFASIEPGSGALTIGSDHNNQWIVSPNEQTKFLRFVNLNTGKTLNNEASSNRVLADHVVPDLFWSGQWNLQFTDLATDEFVLGARHGHRIYLNNDSNDALRTQFSWNVFNDNAVNNRSKWKYSAKFLSELDQPIVRTRDIVSLTNRQSGSILYDPGLSSAGVAKYSPAPNASSTKWLIQNIASQEQYIRLVNADTNRPMNIERANGELQLGKLPIGYWSANWKVDLTSKGYASFENRWNARRHRIYVPEGETSGVAQEARLNKFDSRSEWSYQPAYEVVKHFELIPSQKY